MRPLGASLDRLWRLVHAGEMVVVLLLLIIVVVLAVLCWILELLLLRDSLRRDDLGKSLQARCL
jgi:hypothetical protein